LRRIADTSRGLPLAPLQDLARYWATDYDWRKCEAKLNALPQIFTDGLDIHFIRIRSKHKGALPVIVTHGWPGSILEQIKFVGPLTDPTAFGGRAEDAFDVMIPSIPGYGFSGKPAATGWDHARIARAWTHRRATCTRLRALARRDPEPLHREHRKPTCSSVALGFRTCSFPNRCRLQAEPT
jgi:pimeloyl-ACP methyl ester carboxylesterase